MKEILGQTACELRTAFNDLKQYKRFKADQWLVTIALQPKVDTDINGSAGWTRKTPLTANSVRSNTWNISGPGLQLDAKGDKTSSANFTFKSKELMADKKVVCPTTPSANALAQHLGVGEWLMRTADAMSVAPSAGIDKPTYNSDITVKLAVNGTYTFAFAPGSDIAGFGGSYTLDEQLNISMAPLAPPKQLNVVTLPARQDTYAVPSSVQIQSAQQRLDTIQLEQAIRSLRTQ